MRRLIGKVVSLTIALCIIISMCMSANAAAINAGTAPTDGFEVLHAPFHSRIAQKILVHLPETVVANTDNSLKATLRGPQGETTLLSGILRCIYYATGKVM